MNVGDYVRTINKTFQPSQIAKIQNIEKDMVYKGQKCLKLDHNLLTNYEFLIYEEDVIKSSPNIIDLIKVGDILSFEDGAISRIMEITDNDYYLLKDYGGEQYYERKEYISELTSIVTKEQFESMEYKVGE